MSKLSDFESHICDLLSPIGPVRIRRMFGGSGIYADDRMFGLIANDVVYIKTDARSVTEFQAANSEPFTYEGKGKPVKMSYWRMPDDAFDDQDTFCNWARLGIEAAQRVPVKPKKLGRRASGASKRDGR
ncbi:MAG: TfoX/Sxy family protein [Pseudomonadota bacterium]